VNVHAIYKVLPVDKEDDIPEDKTEVNDSDEFYEHVSRKGESKNRKKHIIDNFEGFIKYYMLDVSLKHFDNSHSRLKTRWQNIYDYLTDIHTILSTGLCDCNVYDDTCNHINDNSSKKTFKPYYKQCSDLAINFIIDIRTCNRDKLFRGYLIDIYNSTTNDPVKFITAMWFFKNLHIETNGKDGNALQLMIDFFIPKCLKCKKEQCYDCSKKSYNFEKIFGWFEK
jgi:hypothetical protein